MKFIYCFYILALLLIEERMWKVRGSTSQRVTKLEYLSNTLDPLECMKLLDAIYSKSLQSNYVANEYHREMIEASERICQLELKKFNRKMKHRNRIESKVFLNLVQFHPVKRIKRNKRFVNMLSNFIKAEDIRVKGKLMPLIFASKRLDSLSKINDEEAIETQTGNAVTSGVLGLHVTEHHGTMTATQSIAHSVPIKGTDDKIAQLMSETGKELANGNTISDPIGGMSSIRWIAFIIFMLFIILIMFITAMITIYTNRGKDGCDGQTFVKRECDDNCPLMNYSSMSPNIERGWTSSSTDLVTPKLQAHSSVSSSRWANIIRKHGEKFQHPEKSMIIMRDKQEQTDKQVKKPRLKVKKAKAKNVKTKKWKKYESKAHRIPDEGSMRGSIMNSLHGNEHDCKCCDCDGAEGDEIRTDEDHRREYEIYKAMELRTNLQDVATETDQTPRKIGIVEELNKEKRKLQNKTEKIMSKSPRLSFHMACANKDSSARR